MAKMIEFRVFNGKDYILSTDESGSVFCRWLADIGLFRGFAGKGAHSDSWHFSTFRNFKKPRHEVPEASGKLLATLCGSILTVVDESGWQHAANRYMTLMDGRYEDDFIRDWNLPATQPAPSVPRFNLNLESLSTQMAECLTRVMDLKNIIDTTNQESGQYHAIEELRDTLAKIEAMANSAGRFSGEWLDDNRPSPVVVTGSK